MAERESLFAAVLRVAAVIFAVLLAVIWTVYGALVIAHNPSADLRIAAAITLASLTGSFLAAGLFVGIERLP